MKPQTAILNRPIYYRLVALWVLCEAMLGGIIHALRIPVSGLIVGSAAVICICLLAFYVPVKGTIIQATIIVAVFKMMLSPQAPILAYAAVFFQGIMGELLFWNKKMFRLSCFLLGLIALLESGLQRIIVLTIVYGNNFWKVINDFINDLTRQKTFTNYSLYIGGSYVLLHVLVGILVGWWAGILPGKILNWREQYKNVLPAKTGEKIILPSASKKKKWKKGLLITWIVLIVLYLQSYFKIGQPLLPSSLALQIFIRSAIIVLAWYLLFGPVLSIFLKKWLEKKQTTSQQDIREVLELLPTMREIVSAGWRSSSGKKGLKRIILCSKIILAKSLSIEPSVNPPEAEIKGEKGKEVFILTGGIQTGKTTALLKWIETRDDVFGILTPVIHGKRFFMDVHTREQFEMEAGEEEEVFLIGRFRFSKKSFEKATLIIHAAIYKNGWLVIDEIGPLELRQEGFYPIIKEVLKHHPQQLIWVVREKLAENVAAFFELEQFSLIKKEKLEQL